MRNLHLLLFISIFFLCCSSSELSNSTGKDVFQWDFSTNKKYVYTFNQISNVVFEDLTTDHNTEMSSKMKANLNIRVKSKEFADLSLTDVKLSQNVYSGIKDPERDSPSMVVQDMDPKGKFKTENQDMLFKLMLPLPSKNLEIGESDFIPLEMPMHTNGSVLFAKGGTKITYEKDTIINDEILAKLSTITDISEIDIPEELEGVHEASLRGNSSILFNKEKGCFVSSRVEFQMSSYTETEEKIRDNTHLMKDRITNENFIFIELVDINDID